MTVNLSDNIWILPRRRKFVARDVQFFKLGLSSTELFQVELSFAAFDRAEFGKKETDKSDFSESESSKKDSNKDDSNKVGSKVYARIVLVDDDALTNMLNKKIIQSIRPDIPIKTFIEVDEAIEFLKENDQAGDTLIFLDINFPIKNGWDFLEEYNQFKTQSSVVLLSSSIDVVEKNKSKQYPPVIDFVSKPLTFEYVTKVLL